MKKPRRLALESPLDEGSNPRRNLGSWLPARGPGLAVEPLQEVQVFCPYCGERISLLLDVSLAEEEYVEDCEVCCQPIRIRFSLLPDGSATVKVIRERDV
ncbi:MAG: CPXCG motif-containing cysteine-rich protein [Lysobacterales bacterium]